uniref:Potassium channel domain-containing protein n=1 Tax=Globodera rostochiensis TaxID=31243 RepID=A0A914HHD0_GLORO
MSFAVRSGGSVKKKKSDEVSLVQKKSSQDQLVDQQGPFRSCLHLYRKPLAVNALCLCFLLFYSLFGGFIFLHFEEPNWKMSREREMAERLQCVEGAISAGRANANGRAEEMLAERIVVRCVLSQGRDERMEWNLKNAVLFGFGILTTLGYGKIEPQTTEGRLFTVFYGFLGVPFTVIIFTNFGRYLQRLERCVRKRLWRQWRRFAHWRHNASNSKLFRPGGQRKGSWMLPPITVLDEEGHGDVVVVRHQNGDEVGSGTERAQTVEEAQMFVEDADDDEAEEDEEEDQISPLTLVFIVFLYLLLGAMLIDWLDDSVDFANGIYFAFLCLTAIEYGKLIPTDPFYLPLVIAYICFGLAISTIALDIGSTYVKRLYYLGRKIRNIASIKIWFGAKHLRVRELLAALGHNIGLEPTVLCDLDLEQLISSAIQVKEGRLHRVPQTHMIMDGIWPPELVPLFLKDGTFPEWVDADERRKWSVASVMVRRRSIRGGSAATATLSQPLHKQSSMSGSARSAAAASLLLSQPPERTPPLPPVQPDRLSVVRFEEFVRTQEDDRRLLLSSSSADAQRRKCCYYPPMLLTEEAEPDSTTSGINSDPDLSFVDTTALPTSSWSLSVPSSSGGCGGAIFPPTQMRRSETVPPVGHPDSSLFYMCTFPSMEMSGKKAPPLPPLAPLPPFTEAEEEEEDEVGYGGV